MAGTWAGHRPQSYMNYVQGRDRRMLPVLYLLCMSLCKCRFCLQPSFPIATGQASTWGDQTRNTTETLCDVLFSPAEDKL